MTLPLLKHTEAHLVALLHEAGGTATLDLQGRVIAESKPPQPLPSDLMTWMRLVAKGVIAGERDRLMLTELGREAAQKVIAGRTREAV